MPTDSDDDGKSFRRLIIKAYRAFLLLSRADNESLPLFQILHNKVYGNPLRGRFAYALYHWLTQHGAPKRQLPPEFFEQQLPFILEVIISVQYYHNQILDRKGGVTTHAAINDNLIMGNLLKDQLYRYIEHTALDEAGRVELRKSVRAIFEYVDIGQYIEKSCNTFEAYRSGQWSHPFDYQLDAFIDGECLQEVIDIVQRVHPIERQDYLRIYLQRIYLTNAALFKITARLIAGLLEVEPEAKNQVVKFATLFGIMQQVVNDNSDWLPSRFQESTVEKGCSDVFCDIDNKIVTLPAAIHLERNKEGVILSIYENHKGTLFTEAIEEELFDEIAQYHSIYFSMTIGKQLGSLLVQYSDNESYMIDLCRFAGNNKFYQHYYNMKIYYDNYKKNKRYNQNE